MWTQRPIGTTRATPSIRRSDTTLLRKEAEAALLHAMPPRPRIAPSEFRHRQPDSTPINGVIGFAQILADSPLSLEQRTGRDYRPADRLWKNSSPTF
jgi:hypothetical protein